MRSRSLSESVSSRSGRSAPQTLKPIDLGLPPRKKAAQTTSLGGVTSEASGTSLPKHRSATSSHDSTTQATPSSNSLQEDTGRSYSGAVPLEGKDSAQSGGVFEALKMHESEGDFARHVRGTSTPIDMSPSVSQNQAQSDTGRQSDGAERGVVRGNADFYDMTSEEILQYRGESVTGTVIATEYLERGGYHEDGGMATEYLDDGGVATRYREDRGVATEYLEHGDVPTEYIDNEGVATEYQGQATAELNDEDIDESLTERAQLKRADAIESEESKEGGGLCETS